jgi:hypothetical protein
MLSYQYTVAKLGYDIPTATDLSELSTDSLSQTNLFELSTDPFSQIDQSIIR